MNRLLSALKVFGTQAAAQFSGPKAWVYSLLYKAAIFILNYWKAKHELKKQFEEKLEAYEKSKADQTISEEKKDEDLDSFLK